MPLSKPVPSYANPRYRLGREGTRGIRGSSGRRLSLLTTFAGGPNANLLLTAREATAGWAPVVAFEPVLAGAPVAVYDHGVAARVVPTGKGWGLWAREAGVAANHWKVQVVDAGGVVAPLAVRVAGNLITVRLGRAASAVNSTIQNVVDALNAHSEVSTVFVAFATGAPAASSVATVLDPTSVFGGQTVPDQVTVGIVAGTTTAANIVTLLRTSQLVQAAPAPGGDGSGVVAGLGATPLGGGVQATGALGVEATAREALDRLRLTAGQSIGKHTYRSTEVRGARLGSARILKTVGAQAKVITNSSDVNYAKEHKPRSPFL